MIRSVVSVLVLSCLLVACSPQTAEKPAASEAASEAVEVSSLAAADYASPATALTCDWPVDKTDTAESLLATYKSYAQVGDIVGAEGQTEKGVIIYGNDPRRRVEVLFSDEDMTEVSAVRISGDSQWSGPKGLHLGSTVADIETANDQPFKLGGFGRDHSSYAILKSGRLAHLHGGCKLSLRLESEGELPNTLLGDRTLDSTDADLIKASPVVQVLAIGWPKSKADDELTRE